MLFIAAPFVILDGLNFFFTSRFLTIVAFNCAAFLYFYIVYLLVKNLLAIKTVTADLLFCAVSTYLLIGMGWSGIYTVVESISPGSFTGGSEPVDLLYFSFVSLTTLGYGDVLPLSAIGKRLVIFEATMGSIYMAVIVAIIVGRYMSIQSTQGADDEIS